MIADLDLARRRARDRQRDRPERRRQDDALQPHHRRLPRRTRATSCFEGESIVGLPPHQITQRGIARTFQTLRLFLNMTVKENVMAAAYGHTRAGVVRVDAADARHAARGARDRARSRRRSSSFFGQRLMGYRWDQPAYSLSYANRRRLEIARAMATNAAAAPARRAGRRDEPGRDARDHRADRQAARRGRLHDPRDRARHARRRGHLRPRRRARPRRQDRRGLVRRRWRPTRRWSRRTSGAAQRRGGVE